ncbi:transporter [Acidocella sp.]|uniref:transporter n=1 Tax=Acidocella sp. TaxID=50710 RepID=UPI003D06E4E2
MRNQQIKRSMILQWHLARSLSMLSLPFHRAVELSAIRTPFLQYKYRRQGDGLHAGDQLFVDLTVLHNFGKWSVGPVAYYTMQVTPDKNQGIPTTVHHRTRPVGGV